MRISTVITTYNRAHCVGRAVRSALATFPGGEVVVVDDASSDNTVTLLRSQFAKELCDGTLRLVCLEQNVGVSGAKNAGFELASSDWVIFLDSDDEYSPSAGDVMVEEIGASPERPIVFFRCRDEEGGFVGTREGETIELSLPTYLAHTSFGEALTAMNKSVIGSTPPYPQELRGYEGLGCARLIDRFGPALLSKYVGRIFYQQGADRLSMRRGFLGRMPLLARGHVMMVREFRKHMPLRKSAALLVKSAVYAVLGASYALYSRMVR